MRRVRCSMALGTRILGPHCSRPRPHWGPDWAPPAPQVQHVLNSMEILDPDAMAAPDSPPLPAAASAATPAWRRGPDMVLPRSAHACVVLGGRVYALGGAGGGGGSGGSGSGGGGGGLRGSGSAGGGGGGGGGTHRSGEVLDLGSGCWQLLGAGMATERKYLAAAAHGGRIYVCGGVSDSRSRLSSLEALDPREGRWRSLPPMAAPRSSHAMAALGGCLYVAGGQSSSGDAAASAAVAAAASLGAHAAERGSSWGSAAARSGPYYGPGLAFSPPLGPGPYGAAGVYGSAPSTSYGGVYGGSPVLGGAGGGVLAGWAPGGGGGGGPLSGGGTVGGSMLGSLGGGGGAEDGAVHQTVECYDSAAGRWRLCAPLPYGGRAGMALCAA
ncbi:hypothetical protein GPECTOR_57g530 [Gonium pectorale]|uniref:Uncharacterized protein n=1 Tax=Gonium pectorale TaxID=33097 RepID=A0A150G7C1_GONPE|nr:hypothetical protein GPECTOR_57g530 [Gonium pectorale]|eukprot:KXZ45240.1 hypothetical protein GPECTOR_57g530 [Gonium pectorale]